MSQPNPTPPSTSAASSSPRARPSRSSTSRSIDEHALAATRRRTRPRDLHVCRGCGSDLVYPLEWDEAGTTHWEVTLRCPNCEWTGTGIFDQDAVERFDEELDGGTEALVRDLKRLMRANMEDEVERFSTALARRGHPPRGLLGRSAGPRPGPPRTRPDRRPWAHRRFRRPPIRPSRRKDVHRT